MPTVMTHAVVPLALGLALGRQRISPRLLAAGALAAMLPDADVVAFKLGIAYADDFGHRGASHSFAFAAALAALGALAAPWLRAPRWRAAWWLFLCAASHPLLDALTDGGLGVALYWPWSDARIFAPWRPIEVSPIGARFFSARGLEVLWSEAQWVVLPALSLGIVGALLRKLMRAPAATAPRRGRAGQEPAGQDPAQ
ncbi:metal-dependent hydrolase [Lysobacter yananisis]|uniref:Metal-dependent hydrolase n=1 Tax=Lysobacter yananisis TaxID=1003114 RepID=A0ABY9PGI7_9GAMM|nr:metal-dependent hydrolase [Lysobacter yananisis]WMT05578.1 metal-dependent hydrolase [Lysobacter yananisis]